MPTKNVETQPEKEMDTVIEFNNGYAVLIGKELENDLATRTDFVGEASLYHKDEDTLLAEFNCYSDDDEFFGEIVLFDKEKGQTNPDECIQYNVDITNPNWKEDLARAMVDFGISKESITQLNADKEYGQPEIVEVRQNGNEPIFKQPESISGRSSIEKREEVFNMIAASGVMNTAWNEDKTHSTDSILTTPFINKSLYYQDGELVYKDANYQHYETPDIFKISKQDFERHSPQAIALAVMKGVEEYKKMYRPEKSPEQSPTKRNDLQHTVNVGLQQYDNMFSPEIQKTHRLDILASQEKHRSHSVSGSPKEQTALQGGISSPENSVKFDDFGVPENGNAMKIDTSLPFEEQYKQYQLAEEWISRQSTEASAAVQYLQGQKGFSGFNPERLEKAIAEESRLAKQLDDLRQANPEFALMARAKHLDPKDMTPELRSKLERVSEWVAEKNTVKHDLNTLTETLTPQEQALQDGKALAAADEKVGDAKWALNKQPNNTERQAAYQQAIAEREELHNEIKQRVSDAMDKGEPYIIRYDELPTAPFNGAKAPIELVVTQKGNLRTAIGTLDKQHNLTAVDSTPELALNTEQRSSPKRTAEVLRERFNQPTAAVADRIACINYLNVDKVFSEQEIKDTLNKALRSSFKEDQLAAIKSPVMRGEWLSQIADNPKATKKLRQAAKNEMAERYGESKPQGQAEKQSLKQTADKGGFSSPVVSEKQEKEEELATIADYDDYGRD